jgi:hypothetical protein
MTTTVYCATCAADVLAYDNDLDSLLDWLAGVHEEGEDLVVWRNHRVVLVLTGEGQTLDLRNRGLGLLGGMQVKGGRL